MPFNLKQFLKKIDKTVAPKVVDVSKPEPVPEVKPEPVQEPVQEISVPEYVPVEDSDSDIETHLHSIILSSTRQKSIDIERKVPLNPLSDE